MNVNEMIEALTDLQSQGKGDVEVKFSYNYGDHWRTTVAPSVDAVNLGRVVHSAYHDMDKVVDTDDESEAEDDPAGREVVIIA
jgi:hypothetical protein